MLLTILLVLFLLSIIGGGFGYSRYGYVGWSPMGVVLLVVVIFYFSGHLQIR